MVAILIAAALAVFGQAAANSGGVTPPLPSDPDSIVRQLAELPSSLEMPATSKSGPGLPNEWRRPEVYRQIQQLGDAAMPALSRALGDADVRLRRNSVFFLEMAGIAHIQRTELDMDIRGSLPALIKALEDSDGYVRNAAGDTIGLLGPSAMSPVPALVALVKNANAEATLRRSACIALGQIGSTASEALPALTSALADLDERVRWQAQLAIEKIQRPQ